MIFLFLAFVLPIAIFIFLKIFGKNEFAVQPLFFDKAPQIFGDCPQVTSLPYHIPDSIVDELSIADDSLTVIFFGKLERESNNQYQRVEDETSGDPIQLTKLSDSGKYIFWKHCTFFLKDSLNVVAVDRNGAIRGQYVSADREDIDRLLTEVTIILKKY